MLHNNMQVRLIKNVSSSCREGMTGVIEEVNYANGVVRVKLKEVAEHRFLRIIEQNEKWEVVEVDERKALHMSANDYRSMYDVVLLTGDEEWFYEIGRIIREKEECS